MEEKKNQEESPKSFNIHDYGFKPIRESVSQTIAIVDNARKGMRQVFPLKWQRLTRNLLGGLQPGKMYVIAGRPGVGKSAFANQMIFDLLDFSMISGKKVIVLYWSFEMPAWQQILRSGSSHTKQNFAELLSVDLSLQDGNFFKFVKTIKQYDKYPVYFNDRARNIEFVISTCEKIREEKPDFEIINLFDHSRLFRSEKDELKKLIDISQGCMFMQSSLGCINILLSQLNRNIEQEHRAKNQYQPLLSDLFGSDSIGQDAHVVMMLNRPHDLYGITDLYCGHNPQGLLAVHLEKNRDGLLGMIPFQADLSTFTINERVKNA